MLHVAIGILIALLVVALWVTPVILGVKTARRKHRSPQWMWFGVHPMMGWVAYAVLAALPPLKECSQCGEKVKAHAKICPYCMTSLPSEPLT